MQKLIVTFFLTTMGCLSLFGNSFLNNLIVEIVATENAECFGESSGIVELEAINGIAPYSYNLDGEINNSGVFEDLAAGNYPVLVTDQTGCSATINVAIDEPEVLQLTVLEANDTDCDGLMNGSIQLTTTGGTGIYIYTLGAVANTTGLFENLPSGVYEPLVEDENGCEMTIEVTIDVGVGITASIVSQINVDCFGNETGEIEVAGVGGVAPYQYRIDTEVNTSGVFSNLAAGTYSMLIADDIGCETIQNFTISEPLELNASLSQMSDLSCFSANDGSFQIMANGGTGEISYSLNNLTNTTGEFSNLPAGNYELTISDANNCETTVDVEILQPEELQILVPNFGATSCFGSGDGFLQLMGVGGVGAYTYVLNDEVNMTGFFENLPADFYSIEVLDENGCSTETQFTITSPSEIFGQVNDIQNAGCNMMLGSIEVAGTGGTGDFTYTLGMETNETGTFENIEVGTYEILITDANDCTGTLAFNIEEGEDISAMIIDQEDVECFGESTGFVEVEVMSGIGNVTFTLNGETNNTGIFENLAAGNYEVEVTGDGGCTAIVSVTIEEPTEITFVIDATVPLCSGTEEGSILITAEGGAGNYIFALDGEMNTMGLFENLVDAIYFITIEDENGCTIQTEFELAAPNVLMLTILTIQPDNGTDNGSFNVQGAGGTAPYQFSLDGINFQSTPPFSNLMFGDYTAYIIDANGCISFAEVTVPFVNNTYSVESGVAQMSVFPNPFVHDLTIELVLYRSQTLHFTLFSVDGVVVQKLENTFAAGKTTTRLSALENLAVGSYFLQVVGAEFQGYFKVVKL